tara:strand:+ start:191 stop:370 length:180 start_codon:yes stop_codon:yes gene_type:complete
MESGPKVTMVEALILQEIHAAEAAVERAHQVTSRRVLTVTGILKQLAISSVVWARAESA